MFYRQRSLLQVLLFQKLDQRNCSRAVSKILTSLTLLLDAPFLLRFLRTKKFSVPQSCEMLERYLIIRQLYPNWFRNLDCEDPDLAEIINAGYLVPLLERDDGKVVLLSCVGNFDPHKFTAAHMARVHSLVTESLMDDEVNQVAGYNYINDESDFQMSHISLWSLTDIRNILRCIQVSRFAYIWRFLISIFDHPAFSGRAQSDVLHRFLFMDNFKNTYIQVACSSVTSLNIVF